MKNENLNKSSKERISKLIGVDLTEMTDNEVLKECMKHVDILHPMTSINMKRCAWYAGFEYINITDECGKDFFIFERTPELEDLVNVILKYKNLNKTA